jgi:hypothetical protein
MASVCLNADVSRKLELVSKTTRPVILSGHVAVLYNVQ